MILPRRRTTTVLTTLCVSAGALTACSVSTTSVSTTTSATAPTSTSSAAPELDLQLRPVLGIANASAGQCTEPPPPTPAAASSAEVCSQDRILLYSLGPAEVTGAEVTGLEATMTERTPQIQVKLDAQGGAALTRLTAEGMQKPVPQNRLAIVSHGRVQSAPTITEAIDGAVLVITGFGSVDDAQKAIDFLVT